METTITSKGPLLGLDLPEIWRFRELFWTLTWRNILVHYKQTVVGVAWALIKPLLTIVVFTVVFGRLAKFTSEGMPYPLLVMVGVLPWQLFAGRLTDSSQSVLAYASMITKIYFPRVVIPASAVLSNLVDFLITALIFAGLLAWYGVMPGGRVIFLPLFLLLALAASFGAGLWLSALNVRFRDVRFIVPFLVQAGLYISPVGFSTAIIPEKWRLLYSLNPMVGVIDGFRWCLLGQTAALGAGFWLSVLIVLAILLSGLVVFSRMERTFADII